MKKFLLTFFLFLGMSDSAIVVANENASQSHKPKLVTKQIMPPPSRTSIQFFKALQAGNIEMMDMLLGQGADINCGNCMPSIPSILDCKTCIPSGETPLMLAMESVDSGSTISRPVRYLVEKNAKLDIQDKDGKTALMYGVSKGFSPYYSFAYQVMFLLENGANPALSDKDGNNMLHYAYATGYERNKSVAMSPQQDEVHKQVKAVTRMSIEHGLDVNQQNLLGETPLHFAAAKCLNVGVEYLLSLGANPSIKTKRGETAQDYAVAKAIDQSTFQSETCNETVHILQNSNKVAVALVSHQASNSGHQTMVTYAGTYAGTYIGSNAGTFQVTILQDGTITFNGYSSRGDAFTGEGKLNSDGSIAIASDSTGSTFSGSVNQDMVSGTWKNIKLNQAGSFQGRKGAEFVKASSPIDSPIAGFFGALNKILAPQR